MRKSFIQPFQGINLDATHPQVPVEMRTGDTTGRADLADQLSCTDVIADSDVNLGLVIDATKDPVTMIDDGRVPMDGLNTGVDHHAAGRSVNVEGMSLRADPEIDTGVEGMVNAAVV